MIGNQIYSKIYVVGIGLLYCYFSMLLVDVALNKNDPERMTKEYILGFIIGVIGMFVGNYMKNINKNGGYGLSLGGLFLVITCLFAHWDSIDSYIKLFVSGGALLALLYTTSN